MWGDHDWDVVHIALTQTHQPETIAWLDGTVGGRQPHGGRGSALNVHHLWRTIKTRRLYGERAEAP